MTLIHMMVGIPASGKSTFARKMSKDKNIPIVSSDETRNKHPEVDPRDIWPLVYLECYECLDKGQEFIFDATNITAHVRKLFIEKIEEHTHDFEVGVYFVVCDKDECVRRCIERNKDKNERYLPPEVILDYANRLEEPKIEEGYKFVEVIK